MPNSEEMPFEIFRQTKGCGYGSFYTVFGMSSGAPRIIGGNLVLNPDVRRWKPH